jgi:hypothetical protein
MHEKHRGAIGSAGDLDHQPTAVIALDLDRRGTLTRHSDAS